MRRPKSVPITYYDELDSSNEECRRLLQQRAQTPFAVVADRQQAGRGRHGRVWQSEPGNLYYSYSFSPILPLAKIAPLSFVAGLAVYDALQKRSETPLRLSLKWPNDVLCNGKKLAGILIESEEVDGKLYLILGIGINLVQAPSGTSYPATSLYEETGVAPDRDGLAETLGAYLTDYIALWQSRGFGEFRQRWLEKAAFIGQKITISDQTDDKGRALAGIFLDIDPNGALLLQTKPGHIIPVLSGLVN